MPGRSLIVLISDGISNPRDDEVLEQVLSLLRGSEVEIISVCVGEKIAYKRLLGIADNKSNNVIRISNYDQLELEEVAEDIVERFCKNVYL